MYFGRFLAVIGIVTAALVVPTASAGHEACSTEGVASVYPWAPVDKFVSGPGVAAWYHDDGCVGAGAGLTNTVCLAYLWEADLVVGGAYGSGCSAGAYVTLP